jgi:hypothetical protein
MRTTQLRAALLLTAAVAVLAGCGSQGDPRPASAPAAAPTTSGAGALRPAVQPGNSRGQPLALSPPTSRARQVTSSKERPAATLPATPSVPHFATPQGAMRYLAAAYNRIDLVALKHVTTPQGRAELLGMRPYAVNLRLVGCKANSARGDYDCTFSHDYPAAMHKPGKGSPAIFTVAPADRVGWYMTVLESCG